MFGRYRGKEFVISCECVLEFGECRPHDVWSVMIDGEHLSTRDLNSGSWDLDTVEMAVKSYLNCLLDGEAGSRRSSLAFFAGAIARAVD